MGLEEIDQPSGLSRSKIDGQSPFRVERQRYPGVPGRKGASLFYMIPLERWNVERKVTFCGKREVPDDSSTSSRTPIGRLER